jgi:hypothetical protein
MMIICASNILHAERYQQSVERHTHTAEVIPKEKVKDWLK